HPNCSKTLFLRCSSAAPAEAIRRGGPKALRDGGAARCGCTQRPVRRVLGIRERTLGSDRPNTATTLNNLARLHYRQGRYEQAEPLYQRALAIWKRSLGPDHPYTAAARRNYAMLLRQLVGRLKRSRWNRACDGKAKWF